MNFTEALSKMPIVAALRGIQENEVATIGNTLIDAGITVFEIPIRTGNAALGEPDDNAFTCIKKFSSLYGNKVSIVAGTVMQVDDLKKLLDLGVEVCLSLGLNIKLVEEASKLNLGFIPGVETISEAMNAISSGAIGLKLFPAVFLEPDGEMNLRHSPGFVNYLRKFVSCPIIPSGNAFINGVGKKYIDAGAAGINVGAQLYEKGIDPQELFKRIKFLTNSLSIE